VEQKLRNQSVRLKEYLIGVSVFDRGEAFNPGADPIVRVQARRLRAKLNFYYETEGRADAVQIDLPCGGYVPVFQLRTVSASQRTPETASRPSVVVLPFVNIGPHENERFSDGLTEELIHVHSQASALRVVARTSAFQFEGKTHDIQTIGEQLGVDAVVEGSVRSDGDTLRVSAGRALYSAASGMTAQQINSTTSPTTWPTPTPPATRCGGRSFKTCCIKVWSKPARQPDSRPWCRLDTYPSKPAERMRSRSLAMACAVTAITRSLAKRASCRMRWIATRPPIRASGCP
jgi:TolB-like protein